MNELQRAVDELASSNPNYKSPGMKQVLQITAKRLAEGDLKADFDTGIIFVQQALDGLGSCDRSDVEAALVSYAEGAEILQGELRKAGATALEIGMAVMHQVTISAADRIRRCGYGGVAQ